MIHYFYGTLQVGIGQTLCSFEHVSCFFKTLVRYQFFFTKRPPVGLSCEDDWKRRIKRATS